MTRALQPAAAPAPDDVPDRRCRAKLRRRTASLTARLTVLAIALLAACSRSDSSAGAPVTADTAARLAAADSTRTPRPAGSARPAPIPLVPTPNPLRGLYVNRWAALGTKMWQLIDVAKTTEVNALVIDVKDDRGFVLYRSAVPLARQIGADTNMPMRPARVRAILDSMRAHGIYPIARIVVAKDPLLAAGKPEWTIRRKDDPAKPWLDERGLAWLDPHQRGVWQYAVDLGKEAVALGFSEVQFDYMRFPDNKRLVADATFPLANGRLRAAVIREQIAFSRAQLAPLKVPFAGDVFGLTTSDTTDMGIGQRWESFVDQLDMVLPMTYPSHYAPGSYKLANPNARPYETIDRALKDAKRRSAGIANAARIVPWYQDFTLGPPHYYAEQVRAQMRAGYDNGVRDWMLWNPGSRYTVAALRPEGAPDETRRPTRAPVARDSVAGGAPAAAVNASTSASPRP